MACHGGRGPAKSEFSMAGTVFTYPDKTDPVVGAVVTLTDSTKKQFAATTNAAGNMFVHADEWKPAYPVGVGITYGAESRAMTSHVGRDGSCAGCHHDPPGTESPGHVYFEDVGTPFPAGP